MAYSEENIMGMYTTINESTIGVEDMEGLKKWIAEMKAGKRPEYLKTEKGWTDTGKNVGPDYASIINIHEKEKLVDFEGMDGWKIIGYWYPWFRQFMRDVAVFLGDGDIEMEYENEELYAHIRFDKGKCLVTTGHMVFQEERSIEEIGREKLPAIPEDLQKQLVARKL